DEIALEDVSDRLRLLARSLGLDFQCQFRYEVGSDYDDVLNRYESKTYKIESSHRFRWQIWNRTERLARYLAAMKEGRLRRERLTVFFTHVVDTHPEFSISEKAMSKYFESIAERESAAFDSVQGESLRTIFPDCRIRTMTDQDHYEHVYRFLNPSGMPRIEMDESISIQENCMFSDLVQPRQAGISFQFDGMNHAVLVMTELPNMIGPGMVTRLTNLGFQDFEVVVNLYPQPMEEVIKKIADNKNQLQGEIATRPKDRDQLGEEAEMGGERIRELVRGRVHPVNIFLAVRLWHADPDMLLTRASMVKWAFQAMSGSMCHHATDAETARQLWFNTWPGWTWSHYRGYDLPSDDHTVAELIPFSASFTGRLEESEALYDSPRGGLVGLTTQVGGVPQHMLIFGLVGAGKSILLTDLWAQIGHLFGYCLIVEEGMSHGTTIETAGGKPIEIQPGGSVTINYLDVNGIPLTNEQLGAAVAINIQMLRETESDQGRISELQAILTQHIKLLYDHVWIEWARQHPEETRAIERRAFMIHERMHETPNREITFLEAWKSESEVPGVDEPDDTSVAAFAISHETRGMVRDLGLSYLKPGEMPTHAELVELMVLTPIGGAEANRK